MMAFFLLMWLINTTTPEQKRGIADYFAAQNISKSSSGSGGVLAGTVFGAEGARAGGAITADDRAAGAIPPQRPDAHHDRRESSRAARPTPKCPNREFEQAEMSLRQAMQQMPDIAELSRNLMVNETAEGLNIQLVDQEGQAMFQPGTAIPLPEDPGPAPAGGADRRPPAQPHFDHRPYRRGQFRGPERHRPIGSCPPPAPTPPVPFWPARASNSDRIFEVAGKAGTDPLLPNDPYASSNRRISILLMREAPVVPPGYRL